MLPELLDQECAQRSVAKRPAFKPVGRKRCALALENRGGGRDQVVDRRVIGIVMPAAEIVFGKPGPFWRGWRQSGGEERREIERHTFTRSARPGTAPRVRDASLEINALSKSGIARSSRNIRLLPLQLRGQIMTVG